MRLWHYRLISHLPNSQLVAQWRELNSIFKNQNRHILINYVYEYEKKNLLDYSLLVVREMLARKYKLNFENMLSYFDISKDSLALPSIDSSNGKLSLGNPFPNHHTARYLKQCFWNLAEKFDRKQKDFPKKIYDGIRHECFDVLDSCE